MRKTHPYTTSMHILRTGLCAVLLTGCATIPPVLHPVVEVEEEVYRFEPANNGAGPMWCSGSTCLVREGNRVVASGIETLKDHIPLNNCRWMLFQRDNHGWQRVQTDPLGRTREPSPLVGFPNGRVFLSVNPTLSTNTSLRNGPASPGILEFAATTPKSPFNVLRPEWDGAPAFTEHSYRSFAADGPRQELVLFQNIGYTHAEWTFRDHNGKWTSHAQLKWPWGAEYDTPQPVRICYPNVALKNRAIHFCGVSDIEEPYGKWRAFKKNLTGNNWDYDFRRLFYTWSPDITKTPFSDWIEIASCDKTCGWISPGDLWVAPDGAAHIIWTERAIDERLRNQFFPGAVQSHTLNYAIVRSGKVIMRRTLIQAEEGKSKERPSPYPRFHVTPDNRLFVLYHVSGANADGKALSENRIMELCRDGSTGPAVRVPLQYPMNSYFTASVRGGSLPSQFIDLLGTRSGGGESINYARIRLCKQGAANK